MRTNPRAVLPSETTSLLDVGCNIGSFLQHSAAAFPGLKLSGAEVNRQAFESARDSLPESDIRLVDGPDLPFPDAQFDCVTSFDVLEHVPAEQRRTAIREMARVLKPSGTIVIKTPHAGAFQWLDSNNLRFRFPTLYRMLIGKGRRDSGYDETGHNVVWHHHFTRLELAELCSPWLTLTGVEYGGLWIEPLSDLLRWPFYRTGRANHSGCLALERACVRDIEVDYGEKSSSILCRFRKP
jgi:SAM-dependent methyltransferase